MFIYKHTVHAAPDGCNLELDYYWIIEAFLKCVRFMYMFDWPHELGGLRKETSSTRLQDNKANQYQDRNSYTPLRKVRISLHRLPQNSHSF